jgi:hypothetical protein
MLNDYMVLNILPHLRALLGVSLRIPAEGTHSYPHHSGFQILNMIHHVGEELVVMFCKEPKVARASTWRLRRIDAAEVGVVVRAEAGNRRWHASHQVVGVPPPPPPR